jgi:hypothetical protein
MTNDLSTVWITEIAGLRAVVAALFARQIEGLVALNISDLFAAHFGAENRVVLCHGTNSGNATTSYPAQRDERCSALASGQSAVGAPEERLVGRFWDTTVVGSICEFPGHAALGYTNRALLFEK